jgi:MFS family permease
VSVPILINIRTTNAPALSADPSPAAATPAAAAPSGDELLAEAALKVGILLSALTVPMALAAVPGGWLSDRIGYRRTTLIGLGLALLGFLFIWQTWSIDISDWLIALELAMIGVGLGLTFSPVSAAVINAADQDRRGVASALVIILRLVGMTVAISSLTTLALQRVNLLAMAELAAQTTGDVNQVAVVYARITVQVLAEVGLVGAIACILALIPAALGLPKLEDSPSLPVVNEQKAEMPGD